ncbi:MAG: transposase [Synechococcus sp. SB0662_bin_45]|nr:transposase [Synechococcus sp. SB0668_bin_13]MYE20967.1 transposase [Synechococcus sp. SB0662_bin_45]
MRNAGVNGCHPSPPSPGKHEVTLVQKLRYRYRLYPHPLFRTLLSAKAALCGRGVSVMSRWEPTSRCCSNCGHRNGKKELPWL